MSNVGSEPIDQVIHLAPGVAWRLCPIIPQMLNVHWITGVLDITCTSNVKRNVVKITTVVNK